MTTVIRLLFGLPSLIKRGWSAFYRFLSFLVENKVIVTLVGLVGFCIINRDAIIALFPHDKPAASAPEQPKEQPKSEASVKPQPSPPVDMPKTLPAQDPTPSAPVPMPQVATPAPAPIKAEDIWLPLTRDGSIKREGITIDWTMYIKVDTSASVTILANGKRHIMKEGSKASVVGDNGKSCLLRTRNITEDGLEVNLVCYE